MRYTKETVLKRLEYFNTLTGMNFQATYSNGGWDMFEKDANGGEHRSYFGFDSRKTTAEFMEYLYGLNTAFGFIGSDFTKAFIVKHLKR